MTILLVIFSGLWVLFAVTVAITSLHSPSSNVLVKVLHWRAQTTREWVALCLFEGFVAFVIGWASKMLEDMLKTETLAHEPNFWIPDIQPPYSPAELHDLYRGFGFAGRRLYTYIELWDIFVYGYGYALLLASTLQWASREETISRLSMLGWLAWAADQVENVGQTYCVLSFDEEGPNAVWRTAATVGNAANLSKWGLFAVGVGISMWLVVQRYREERIKND